MTPRTGAVAPAAARPAAATALCAWIAGVACAGSEQPGPRWSDVTAEVGLPFESFMCMAFHDLDGDGRPDLLTSPAQPGLEPLGIVAIHRNRGDGGFEPVAVPVTRSAAAMSCVVGDVTGDQLPDIVIGHAPPAITLLRGLGGLAYEELDLIPALDPGRTGVFGVSALALPDFDGDGWRDLYVGLSSSIIASSCVAEDGDVRCQLASPEWRPGFLLRNRGGLGFDIVDAAAAPATAAAVWAVDLVDWNADGLDDLLVSSDFAGNRFYVSSGDGGALQDIAGLSGMRPYNHGMGAAFGDFDGDGRLDAYVADLGPDQLYYQQPDGTLVDRAADVGVASWSELTSAWSPVAGDFDGDGDVDMFVINSARFSTMQALIDAATGMLVEEDRVQADHVYVNDGSGGFALETVAHADGAVPSLVGGVAAAADYDGDGDDDIAEVYAQPFRFRLLRNDW